MEIMRAKLMSLSVYKKILETEPVQALLHLTQAKTADGLIQCYTDLVYSVWNAGFSTLPEGIAWHLKYDESFIGNAIASGTAPDYMKDAAAMDIRRLSSVSMLSCAGLKRNIAAACSRLGEEFASIIQNLAELPMGESFDEEDIFESYRKNGCGQFALGRAFHWEKGQLSQVKHSDPIDQDDMIGYEFQRNAVVENTRVLLSGKPTNNVLLYGDAGTGKSSTVKAIANEFAPDGLRLIEVKKNQLYQIPALMDELAKNPLKFILFIDDLSFSANDDNFAALKAILEGSVGGRSHNVAVYATSNRRHLVKESMSDRSGDDLHAADTRQELMSLAARFGLTVTFQQPDKDRYDTILLELAKQYGVQMPSDQLFIKGQAFALRAGGRSPRVAKQFVELLAAGVKV